MSWYPARPSRIRFQAIRCASTGDVPDLPQSPRRLLFFLHRAPVLIGRVRRCLPPRCEKVDNAVIVYYINRDSAVSFRV